jgi:hypothetical protein
MYTQNECACVHERHIMSIYGARYVPVVHVEAQVGSGDAAGRVQEGLGPGSSSRLQRKDMHEGHETST